MIVRRLTDTDVNAFKSIRLEALKTEPDAFASSYDEALKLSDEDWRARLTQPIVVAAFDDTGTPRGLMGVIRQPYTQMAHRGSLVMVYVAPDARRGGTARKMLAFIEAEARQAGIDQIELEVRADNAAAIRFYETAGYQTYGQLPRAARSQTGECDDLLMVRHLDA